MNKKSASDSLTSKMELINKKVREITDRRKGVKVTRIEDELDRQELKSYMRLMGVEHGSISLESAEQETRTPRNNIFYATFAGEALIEAALIFIAASYLLSPAPTALDYLIAATLLGMFSYLAYVMYRYVKSN
jgi:hypothetical protein